MSASRAERSTDSPRMSRSHIKRRDIIFRRQLQLLDRVSLIT
jgi:hypothetical protein